MCARMCKCVCVYTCDRYGTGMEQIEDVLLCIQ